MRFKSVLPWCAMPVAAHAVFAQQQQNWSAPRSYEAGLFAQGLYSPQGQAVLLVLGDSINATHAFPGMQVGYRDQFEMPFNGWVVHANSGSSEIGYTNAIGNLAVNEIRVPGEVFSSGVSAIAPVHARDIVWAGDVDPGHMMSDSYILNVRVSGMLLGNPFASSAIVDARMIMYEGATQVNGFEAAGMRGLTTVSTGNYVRPFSVANAIRWIDRELIPSTADPGIRLRSDTTTSESAAGANTLIHLGTRFRARIPNSVQVQFIALDAWTAADHVDQTKCTDEALRQYYTATDPPTHIILWIGQNQTVAEANDISYNQSYQVYKADVEAIIERHERIISDLHGTPPQWLLVSQYKTGYEESQHELMCAGLYRLAAERPRVGFLNLYRLAGGESFNTAQYLSDGIHPSREGAHVLASLMNEELKSAIAAPCPADFDRSGFVDVEDFSLFVVAFLDGSIDADADASGYVDVEDYNAFVQRFEEGC